MPSIRDQLLNLAAQRRMDIITATNGGEDDDLPEDQRPNRALIAPRCRLKDGDEAVVYGLPVIVVCPGRGIGWFYALTIEEYTIGLGQYQASDVTGRIPFDPEETPLPIWIEEPTPDP